MPKVKRQVSSGSESGSKSGSGSDSSKEATPPPPPKKHKKEHKERDRESSSKSKPSSSSSRSSKKREEEDEEEEDSWSLEKNKFVKIREFKGKIYVDIREFYEKNGQLLPGKKGISLPVDQWKKFCGIIPEVNDALKNK